MTQVCISVESHRDDSVATTASVVPRPQPAEACFATAYNAQLSGFDSAQGSHRLTVRLRAATADGATVGDGVRDFSISVDFRPILLLLGPLIISARVLEIWTHISTKSC